MIAFCALEFLSVRNSWLASSGSCCLLLSHRLLYALERVRKGPERVNFPLGPRVYRGVEEDLAHLLGTFKTKVLATGGNTTGIEVPAEVVATLGPFDRVALLSKTLIASPKISICSFDRGMGITSAAGCSESCFGALP